MTGSRRESLRSAAAASALSGLRDAPVRRPGPPAGRIARVVGVVIETAPGAEPRVAARLLKLPWVALQGGDGDRRIAAVLEAPSGATVQDLAQRLVTLGQEILAVQLTYAASEAEP